MLLGIELTAKEAIAISEQLIAMKGDMETRTSGIPNSEPLLNVLYEYPIINSRGLQAHLKVTLDTAIDRLERLERLGIVREVTGQRRGRVYRFDRYIEILDAGWTDRKKSNDKVNSQDTIK